MPLPGGPAVGVRLPAVPDEEVRARLAQRYGSVALAEGQGDDGRGEEALIEADTPPAPFACSPSASSNAFCLVFGKPLSRPA
jgi:hypothetical protein